MHINMKKLLNKIFVLCILCTGFILVSSGDILAQCAMCKASVETNANAEGGGFASQLNFGILYLFAAPYLLAMVIAYLWYKKSKEHKRQLEHADSIKHRIANI
jgi:hypothetical protein